MGPDRIETLPPPTPPGNHPVDVGLRSEAIILAELTKRGYSVLMPFGVNHRYDFVLDMGDRFLRVQCKTGRLRNGGVTFSTESIRSNTKQVLRRGYAGEVDWFLVYCPDTEQVYAVPIEAASGCAVTLRIARPENNQSKRIRWAADHVLPA